MRLVSQSNEAPADRARTPQTMRAEPLNERFARKYIPEPNSGCWLWTGSSNHRGYGTINAGGPTPGSRLAHRVSWTLANGEIPDGLWVLHRCDVPSCVNPDHLFLGTHDANMEDMVAKGRSVHRHGERNPRAKLSDGDVEFIRQSPESRFEIAAKFSITPNYVRQLRAGHASRIRAHKC